MMNIASGLGTFYCCCHTELYSYPAHRFAHYPPLSKATFHPTGVRLVYGQERDATLWSFWLVWTEALR